MPLSYNNSSDIFGGDAQAAESRYASEGGSMRGGPRSIDQPAGAHFNSAVFNRRGFKTNMYWTASVCIHSGIAGKY